MFKDRIKKSFPEYDENRNYFHGGEIVKLHDRQTVVCILDSGLESKFAIVVSDGSMGRKGDLMNVFSSAVQYVEKNITPIEYLPIDFLRNAHECQEGDVIKLKYGFLGIVLRIDYQSNERPWADVYVFNKYDTKIKEQEEFQRHYGGTRIAVPLQR